MLCVVLRVQTFGGGLLRGVDCRGSSGAAPCPVSLSGLGAGVVYRVYCHSTRLRRLSNTISPDSTTIPHTALTGALHHLRQSTMDKHATHSVVVDQLHDPYVKVHEMENKSLTPYRMVGSVLFLNSDRSRQPPTPIKAVRFLCVPDVFCSTSRSS